MISIITPSDTAVVFALAASLVSYVVTGRKISGKIGTSEASDLWKESSDIRSDYRERLEEAYKRIEQLEERVTESENRNNILYKENSKLIAMNIEHERTITKLTDRLETLERENKSLRDTIRRAFGKDFLDD